MFPSTFNFRGHKRGEKEGGDSVDDSTLITETKIWNYDWIQGKFVIKTLTVKILTEDIHSDSSYDINKLWY